MWDVLPAPCKVAVAGAMGRGQGWQGVCCTVATLVCAGVPWTGTVYKCASGHGGVFQHLYRSKVSQGSVVASS